MQKDAIDAVGSQYILWNYIFSSSVAPKELKGRDAKLIEACLECSRLNSLESKGK